MKNKNNTALKPPMGWNSWDCYGAGVTEEQLLGNAQYMQQYLKPYGWQYVVCDIQWYEPTAAGNTYNNFTELCMDDYSRLIPAENRFPSAANGKGFKPIADRIHDMGLKFGIHIMRGIPRQAVHQNTPLLGTTATARQIAHHFSVCPWNTDMYGVDCRADGAQAYYDSIFSLYAEWGVDFIKVDDIANTEFKPHEPYSAKDEIEMIRRAINKCGRAMVLSLSPGPAQVEAAAHLAENANMWRMSGDFWDRWDKLRAMFDYCKAWYPYVSDGCFPDCDMLPLGRLCKTASYHGGKDRSTQFTKDEQITMMTLWCVFRSPLFFGGELRDNDAWTLSLLTNEEVLDINQNACGAVLVSETPEGVVWQTTAADHNSVVALFNFRDTAYEMQVDFSALHLCGRYAVRDLWQREICLTAEQSFFRTVPPHGAVLLKFIKEDT